MKFLLFGGTGYVGGRLAEYLKSNHHHVTIASRRPSHQLPSWVVADDVFQVNFTDKASLAKAIEGKDVVINLASPNEVESSAQPADVIRAGGESSWNILDALLNTASKPPFIYLSTFHVYGRNAKGVVTEDTYPHPVHPYALGKFIGEAVTQFYRKDKGARTLCVRLSNSFGAPISKDVPRWSLVFNDLCLQAVENKKLTLRTTGDERRNFVAMGDVVRALEFLAVENERWPKDGLINLGSDFNWSIKEVATLVSKCAQEELGTKVLVFPSGKIPADQITELTFSVERLRNLGFKWLNEVEKEVRATLRLCR